MVSQILQTKLYIPRSKPRQVSRPRLLDKLDNLRERKLALISAPAGFGKTTLLAEWIERQSKEQAPLQITWLSLDSNDNDPARFLTYFVSALQIVDANLGGEVLSLLNAFQISSMKQIWEILAGHITSIQSPFLLVLDDFHVIDAPVIHEGIAFMLEQMPDCMHLVISTRADPPLPLSRLRVSGELVELRVSDLRFTSEEIADFFVLWIGKKLTTVDQAEFENRTEGWIAGVQLAALAMQDLVEKAPGDEDSLSVFIHRLSGSTRFIMDYLVEEVLQRLPENARSFMLQTSILEHLTASLCDTLTDRHDSQVMLVALEKTNVFLFPLDNERRWYRYHHLFVDLLRSLLQAEQPDRLPELHYRASVWYADQGLMTEAIQHALKVPDLDEAARLMETVSLEMLLHGESTTLQKWSTFIPEEIIRERPNLCIYFTWSFLAANKIEQAAHYLSLLDQEYKNLSTGSPDLQGHVTAAYGMLAFLKGDYENAIHFAGQALKQLSPEQPYLRGVLAYSSGSAYQVMGEDDAALQAYQEAMHTSHTFGNRTIELLTLKRLGDLHKRRGQLHEAELTYQRALKLGIVREGQFLPVAAATVASMGNLFYEWNRLEDAERCLLQGVDLSRRSENTFALLSNLLNLALVRWVHGDREDALRLRRETEQVLMEFPPHPSVEAQIALQQVRLYLQMKDIQAVVQLAQLPGQNSLSCQAFPMECLTIMRGRVQIAQGNADEAVATLEKALPGVRSAGRWGVVIELLVLQSLALAMKQQISPALASLEEALRLAEPGGYIRLFLDEGEPMARLLRVVYRSKPKGSRDYEARLLEGMLPAEAQLPAESLEKSSGKSVGQPGLIDPLTDREIEILRMIVDGYSNQEIAEKLFVTLGTVKAHISHIYTKLDVRSRTQAVIKADQLHLLNP